MIENNKPVRVPEISISYVIVGEEEKSRGCILNISENKQPQDEIVLFFNKSLSNLKCNGNYVFIVNSNEIINIKTFDMLHFIFKMNNEDVFYIPRETYIKNLSEDKIIKNKWVMSEGGRINYPDFKKCIYKNNGDIKCDP